MPSCVRGECGDVVVPVVYGDNDGGTRVETISDQMRRSAWAEYVTER